MGYIYRVTNLVNGHRYIGQSKCDDIETRWKQHNKVNRNLIGPYLYNAYIKYGIKNFKFEIICICFDTDCDKYEKEYIIKYNTITPNGYNIKLGSTFSKHTEDSKERIKQKLKERYKHDEKMRNNLRSSKRGKIITEEQKQKLSEASKRYWANMTEDHYNKVCNRRKNIKREVHNNLCTASNVLKKRVGQYDEYNNLICSYSSIRAASNQTNICYSTISCVCRGKSNYRSAGGFIWKFID